MNKKLLKERVKMLEEGELETLFLMVKMSEQVRENEKVIEALRENLNLVLDHLKLKLDYIPEQKAKKVLVKKR